MCKLGLTISPQVLIPETLDYLVITLKTGDHKDLLVELGRLWQGIKATRVNPAGHKVVPGTLRGTPCQHRGLDLEEVLAIQIGPHGLTDPVPQTYALNHVWSSKVQISVF